MDPLKELRGLYHDGRLLPFLGAGVSMSVTWEDASSGRKRRGISWGELVDQAAEQLGFRPDLLKMRGDFLQILEYYRIKKGGLGPLINWLIAEMRAPDDALLGSPIHTELARMDKCRTLYTTNYDDYIERALRLQGRDVARVAIESHMGLHPSETEVVKFHGDFDFPQEMVFSESDYAKRLEFNSPLDWRLRSDLLGRAVLFIGYSFQDANVSYLFHTINDLLSGLPEGFSASGRRAFIVSPDPSDFEYTLFRKRNIEVVAISRASRITDITDILKGIRG